MIENNHLKSLIYTTMRFASTFLLSARVVRKEGNAFSHVFLSQKGGPRAMMHRETI